MRDEPWETAATEFELYCGNEEINALLTSMGMVGLFIGAFIAGMYSDKFGRKNAIIVWPGLSNIKILGYIDVGDACCRRNVLVTILRCC